MKVYLVPFPFDTLFDTVAGRLPSKWFYFNWGRKQVEDAVLRRLHTIEALK